MAADVHIEMKASKSIQKGKNNKLNVTIIPKQQLISRNYLLSVHPDCKMPSKQKKAASDCDLLDEYANYIALETLTESKDANNFN